VTGIVPKRN